MRRYITEKGKRRLALALCLCMALSLAPALCPQNGAYATSQTAKLEKRAELVVFIRFKGEKEFVSGSRTKPMVTLLDGSQINLNDWYNAQNAEGYAGDPSLNQFVQKVTYEGTLAKPIYASADGTIMASYECDTEAKDANFGDDNWFRSVQSKALKAVEPYLPKDAKLDYNGDGEVDSCMFLWGPTKDSTLAYYFSKGDNSGAHQWWMDGYKTAVNGVTVNMYTRNFIYSKANLNTTGKTFAKTALIHEYMHTLGVPDLYTEEGWYSMLFGYSYMPVGDWDIQSNHEAYGSTFLSQRVRYLGLGTMKDITQSGRYTLCDVNEPNPLNEVNGYKIPTKRPEEYFVIEYRRGNTDGGAKNHGSGILVYRVNEKYHGNVKEGEEIHLFGQVAGFNSSASMSDSAAGIGDPLSAGFTLKNDLEFSDGTNSGICIRNIGKAGEVISFDVILP